jgi:hypothetical protein
VVTMRGGRHHTSAFRVCGCSFPYQAPTLERVAAPWVDPVRDCVRAVAKQDHTRDRARSGALAAFERQGAFTTGKDGAHLGG